MNKWLSRLGFCAAGALTVVLWSVGLGAQSRTFVARLSPVPRTIAEQATVAGGGAATAVLSGSQLTIEGKFDGLRSPATVARLHMAPRGIRGPAVADLMVPRATNGTFKAVVQLSDQQRQALEKSSLYIQIHSEKAPDGSLWGWLVPQEVKR